MLGAIIGGVVGHQFGNSSGGRDRGTAAGAIVGGIVGNQIENSAPSAPSYAGAPVASNSGRVDYIPETRNVQRCRTVYDGRDEVTGYNVAYRYQGRDYTTRMAYDPGPTMRVQVAMLHWAFATPANRRMAEARAAGRTVAADRAA